MEDSSVKCFDVLTPPELLDEVSTLLSTRLLFCLLTNSWSRFILPAGYATFLYQVKTPLASYILSLSILSQTFTRPSSPLTHHLMTSHSSRRQSRYVGPMFQPPGISILPALQVLIHVHYLSHQSSHPNSFSHRSSSSQICSISSIESSANLGWSSFTVLSPEESRAVFV